MLEEAPPAPARQALRPAHLLVCSARSEPALQRACENLAGHLAAHPELSLDDVAFTLAVGRRSFAHRRAVACTSVDEAVARLRAAPPLAGPRPKDAVFLFPGQGAQRAGMGTELYRSEPTFREAFDRCARVARARHGLELDAGGDDPLAAQPALFAVEYALAALLRAWGIEPRAMIGHSLGEYVAATLAGVFSVRMRCRS